MALCSFLALIFARAAFVEIKTKFNEVSAYTSSICESYCILASWIILAFGMVF